MRPGDDVRQSETGGGKPGAGKDAAWTRRCGLCSMVGSLAVRPGAAASSKER